MKEKGVDECDDCDKPRTSLHGNTHLVRAEPAQKCRRHTGNNKRKLAELWIWKENSFEVNLLFKPQI